MAASRGTSRGGRPTAFSTRWCGTITRRSASLPSPGEQGRGFRVSSTRSFAGSCRVAGALVASHAFGATDVAPIDWSLLVQGPGGVPVVWWTADGGARRASGGPGLSGGAGPAVGADRPASAALCPRLGPCPLSCGRWRVHGTHPAFADQRLDVVGPEARAGERAHPSVHHFKVDTTPLLKRAVVWLRLRRAHCRISRW